MATPPQGEAQSLGTREGGVGSDPELKATHGPPLPRQVGSFDPYSDDPRLGIQKIFLCKYSGYLAVAGTAGQVASRARRGEEWSEDPGQRPGPGASFSALCGEVGGRRARSLGFPGDSVVKNKQTKKHLSMQEA